MATKPPPNAGQSDPQRIFNTARLFHGAAVAINQAGKKLYAIPFCVNAAFGVELYLKCLLVTEGANPGDKHDLVELFRNLKRHTKARLTKRYNKVSAGDDTKAKMRKLGLLTNLETELEQSRHAFVLLRYHFDDRHPPQSGFTVGFLLVVLRDFILEKHPEWEPFVEP